eukprot:768634-Hanusia_phi.AAC.7
MVETATEIEYVRGYLPLWAGPGTTIARLQVSKAGRILNSFAFDSTRSFISLGRSAERVTYCLEHPSISDGTGYSDSLTFGGSSRYEIALDLRQRANMVFRVYVLHCLPSEAVAPKSLSTALKAPLLDRLGSVHGSSDAVAGSPMSSPTTASRSARKLFMISSKI